MALNLFSNKPALDRARQAAGRMQRSGIAGIEAADANQARVMAGEAAAMNIFNALGQPGTYEPGSGTGTYGGGGTNLYQTDSMPDPSLKKMGKWASKDILATPRKGVIDPEGYANAAIGSIPFKMRSKMTAQAYQLLNKEGEEWDMLENSTLGQIHEGAALQLRDTVRRLKNDYAKGGTARRTALAEMGTIQAAERAHQMKVNETWQANIRLHHYTQANADAVQKGNIEYVRTLPGLNAEYRAAMQATASLLVSANEKAALITADAYQLRASQQAKNFGTTLLEGVIMAAGSKLLGGGLDVMGEAMQTEGTMQGGMTGKFMDVLGGGVKAIGGNISGLYGGGGSSQYTPEQQRAVKEAQGVDVNKEILNRASGPRNKPNEWQILTGRS